MGKIELTEDNETVVAIYDVGQIELNGLGFYGKVVVSRVPLDMENEDHRKLVDAFGATFLPKE